MARWLHIIGLGEDGIAGVSPAARSLLAAADVVVGGIRHLNHYQDAFPHLDPAPTRMCWQSPLRRTVAEIVSLKPRRVVVLATGNPQYYGIGVTLGRMVPADEMIIIPAPSAFSLAAARLGWAQAAVHCLTLHGRPLTLLRSVLYPGAQLLLLSENRSTPKAVAALLQQEGFGRSTMSVLNHLGGDLESIHHGQADGWLSPDRQDEVADLNTIAVACVADPGANWHPPRLPGLPDGAFQHDGQLTKSGIRAITLSQLAPLPGQHLWDIGAGAGSVAIEWMRSDPRNTAVAVEKQADRAANIALNAENLGVPALQIECGDARDLLPLSPAPDAIFIGGGLNAALLALCREALPSGGRLVANAVTLSAEALLLSAYQCHGGTLNRFALSQVDSLGSQAAWRSARPVTQLVQVKSR